MVKFLAILLLALGLACPQAQAQTVQVLSGGCGTGKPTPGANVIYMDSNGNQCIAETNAPTLVTTGTLTAAAQTVVFSNTGGYGTLAFDISGTWVGTIVAEVQATPTGAWYGTTIVPFNFSPISTSFSSNTAGQASIAGAYAYRFRATAWTSGTATITLQGGKSAAVVMQNTIPWLVTTNPTAITPRAGTTSSIVTGGVAVTLITGPVYGCIVENPKSATDQGIATAEVAQLNNVTTATTLGNGTNITLQPGDTWSCPPGQTTNVSGIAGTAGHAFYVVRW
jgi:hypothetical protein